MSKYICNDCGLALATLPHRDCPACSSGNIAILPDSVPERLTEAAQIGTNCDKVATDGKDIEEMIRHLLEDLADQVCNAPAAAVEFRDSQIERTIERIRPYLVDKN